VGKIWTLINKKYAINMKYIPPLIYVAFFIGLVCWKPVYWRYICNVWSIQKQKLLHNMGYRLERNILRDEIPVNAYISILDEMQIMSIGIEMTKRALGDEDKSCMYCDCVITIKDRRILYRTKSSCYSCYYKNDVMGTYHIIHFLVSRIKMIKRCADLRFCIMSVVSSFPRRERLFTGYGDNYMENKYYHHMMEIPDLRMPTLISKGTLMWYTWKDERPYRYSLSNSIVYSTYTNTRGRLLKHEFKDIREAMLYVCGELGTMDSIHYAPETR
jgi:hypothetical protein